MSKFDRLQRFLEDNSADDGAWLDVDIFIVVGFKFVDESDGLRQVKPLLIQQYASSSTGGIAKSDGGTLLMMAGEQLQRQEDEV